ncbi:cyclin-dependent kinase 4 inhibitor C [Lampris incognitus]|uniref:cyclin-dependent kinase 4 inhibitor C n=1 Tax=Lampris incognitus TaxID=2546036 RepID=UPI0024B57362|nr:cyclin-dependent kinase 4 inhibitor C [Lampris incognitus]
MAESSLTDKLCNASARGDLARVLFYLQNGANVNGCNTYGRTSLQVVKLGSPAVAEALLHAGADPNVRDPALSLTVTHDAARDGFADMVRVLLDHGADVNLEDDGGNLPLHVAAREGHDDVVGMLIGRTTNPGRPNAHGHTPYDLARSYGRTAATQRIAQYMDF